MYYKLLNELKDARSQYDNGGIDRGHFENYRDILVDAIKRARVVDNITITQFNNDVLNLAYTDNQNMRKKIIIKSRSKRKTCSCKK
jgi:uncharacterized protein (UPF0248 family)